jgi:hypothetical protein
MLQPGNQADKKGRDSFASLLLFSAMQSYLSVALTVTVPMPSPDGPLA